MKKKNILILMFCSSLFANIVLGQQSDTRPNFIYIMADDHTSQAWGIYGGVLKDYVRNVHIKRLAEEGAV